MMREADVVRDEGDNDAKRAPDLARLGKYELRKRRRREKTYSVRIVALRTVRTTPNRREA